MTVVFISNYLTLHQVPFCNKLYETLGEDFLFVATSPMEEERIAMGWQETKKRPYEANIHQVGMQEKIDAADIVLIGSAEERLIKSRLRSNKVVIRYSERILKQGRWHALSPRAIRNVVTQHTAYKNAPVYLLCASAYAAGDYHLFGAYRKKSYKWGYFPEMIPYDPAQIALNKRNSLPQILWVGRLLHWKHPELAVMAASYLHQKGYSFHMNIIGEGEQEPFLRKLIRQNDLEEYVSVLPFMKPAQVRGYMEKANIYLFTSDFQEGWGAVLNEAMNSGCAVVASHAVGAAPFLIKDGENGCLFKSGDLNDLCKKVEQLIANSATVLEIGTSAYTTISKQWNASVAATRLLEFSKALINAEDLPTYQEGPLSRADFLSNHWHKKRRLF